MACAEPTARTTSPRTLRGHEDAVAPPGEAEQVGEPGQARDSGIVGAQCAGRGGGGGHAGCLGAGGRRGVGGRLRLVAGEEELLEGGRLAGQARDPSAAEGRHELAEVLGVDREAHLGAVDRHVVGAGPGADLGEGGRVGERGMHPGSGQVAQLGEAAGVDDPAGAHDAHPVAGALHLAEDVARQQHGAALVAQRGELALEDLLHERVEAGGRLVEHEQRHVAGERRDEGDLLPVALGVRLALLGLVELEALDETPPAVLVDAATEPAEQVDDLATAQGGPEHDVAGHVGELTVQLGGVAPRVAAEDGRGAAVGAQQAEQDADRRRLARAVGSEEAVDLALADAEVESVEGDGGAERLAEAGHGDDIGHARDATPVSEVCECCNLRVCRPAESRS